MADFIVPMTGILDSRSIMGQGAGRSTWSRLGGSGSLSASSFSKELSRVSDRQRFDPSRESEWKSANRASTNADPNHRATQRPAAGKPRESDEVDNATRSASGNQTQSTSTGKAHSEVRGSSERELDTAVSTTVEELLSDNQKGFMSGLSTAESTEVTVAAVEADTAVADGSMVDGENSSIVGPLAALEAKAELTNGSGEAHESKTGEEGDGATEDQKESNGANSLPVQVGEMVSPAMLASRFRAEAAPVEVESAGLVATANNSADQKALQVRQMGGVSVTLSPENSTGVENQLLKHSSADLGRRQSFMAADNAMGADAAEETADTTLDNLVNRLAGGKSAAGKNTAEMMGLGTQVDARLSQSAGQSTDNMLATASNGIVTAAMQSRPVDTSGVNHAPVNVPLLAPSASDALASNVRWMVGEKVQSASVSVSPSGMGPITVKIGIEKELMNVSIVATQGTTRDALEAMLPRLREQLQMQGHESVRVEVSDGRTDSSRGSNGQQLSQERQAFADSQPSNADGRQAEKESSNELESHSNNTDSNTWGERKLSESEQLQVARLHEITSGSSTGVSSLRYGYDFYV